MTDLIHRSNLKPDRDERVILPSHSIDVVIKNESNLKPSGSSTRVRSSKDDNNASISVPKSAEKTRNSDLSELTKMKNKKDRSSMIHQKRKITSTLEVPNPRAQNISEYLPENE